MKDDLNNFFYLKNLSKFIFFLASLIFSQKNNDELIILKRYFL